MPKDKLKELENEFRSKTLLEPTPENLEKYTKMVLGKKIKTVDNDFGMAIVAKITDVHEFEMLWLNHFITHMKPKYLPEDLIKTYNLELI